MHRLMHVDLVLSSEGLSTFSDRRKYDFPRRGRKLKQKEIIFQGKHIVDEVYTNLSECLEVLKLLNLRPR